MCFRLGRLKTCLAHQEGRFFIFWVYLRMPASSLQLIATYSDCELSCGNQNGASLRRGRGGEPVALLKTFPSLNI